MCTQRHGASAKQVVAANARRVTKAKQEALARRWDLDSVPADEHPVEGLLREYRRTAAVVAMLDQLVSTSATGADTYEDKAGIARVTPEIEWWERERDRLAKRSVELLRAGVEERTLRLAEETQAQIGRLVMVALDAAGVTGPARVAALRAMVDAARQARALPA